MNITPYSCHDHHGCIDAALTEAHRLCKARGTRLTSMREQVLQLIWQSYQSMKAYDLLAQLAQQTTKAIQPPTVYHALDFLQAQGLIHRLASINAYLSYHSPDTPHNGYFLICSQCNTTLEFSLIDIERRLQDYAQSQSFQVQSTSIELTELCQLCTNSSEAAQ